MNKNKWNLLPSLGPSVDLMGYSYSLYPSWDDKGREIEGVVGDALGLVEDAGRLCYRSYHRPNPETAHPMAYAKNLIRQGHESVLEHAQLTFDISGVSRAFTHELIRHRHLSYSQESQRYVDATDKPVVVIPPALWGNERLQRELFAHVEDSLNRYQDIVEDLLDEGLSRKQAREAARAVLPNCLGTHILVSGNIRAWRDVLRKRHSEHADAEMQEFCERLIAELDRAALYDTFFSDINQPGEGVLV